MKLERCRFCFILSSRILPGCCSSCAVFSILTLSDLPTSLTTEFRNEGVDYHRLRHIVGFKRMLLILCSFFFPQLVSAYSVNLPRQHIKRILYRLMPRLHSECRRAGSVNRRNIQISCRQKRKIRIIRKSYIPLRRSLFHPLEIHIRKNFAHQLSTTAGDQHITFSIAVCLIQLGSAFLWIIADTNALFNKAVRSKLCLIAQLVEFIQCMHKRAVIWLRCTPKRRCHKSDRTIFR